jgi:hypothetical protein
MVLTTLSNRRLQNTKRNREIINSKITTSLKREFVLEYAQATLSNGQSGKLPSARFFYGAPQCECWCHVLKVFQFIAKYSI